MDLYKGFVFEKFNFFLISTFSHICWELELRFDTSSTHEKVSIGLKGLQSMKYFIDNKFLIIHSDYLLDEERVSVNNNGRLHRGDGELDSATGVATISSNPAKLTVRFPESSGSWSPSGPNCKFL